jgi:hypothetical protein
MTEKKQEDQQNGETRQAAAAAGGYDNPRRGDDAVAAAEEAERLSDSNVTQPDIGAARGAEDADVSDDDSIDNQEAREAAGPFTGTGNQDALRTAGRAGGTDAHHADTRTVEADAKDNTNKEADKATRESAAEQRESREDS